MLRPGGGEGVVCGHRIDTRMGSLAIRRRVGFVSETKDLYPSMTVAQVLRFTGLFIRRRHDRERQYLALFELPMDRPVTKLSKGMRTKLMLLLAMSRGAELLILDEPTDGLDPAMIEDVLRALVGLTAADGVTIFFSSHQLSEVEQIADRVCMIDGGRTVISDSLDNLKAQYRRVQLVFEDEPPERVLAYTGADEVQHQGRTVSILAREGIQEIVDCARSCRATSSKYSGLP